MTDQKKSKQKTSFDDLMDVSSTLSFFVKNEKNINKRIDNGATETDFLNAYEFFCDINKIKKIRPAVFRAVFRACREPRFCRGGRGRASICNRVLTYWRVYATIRKIF